MRCRLLMPVLLIVTLTCLTACDEADDVASGPPPDAPTRGQLAIGRYGCAGCHTIPGIPGADAVVGPPLNRIGSRSYIAVLRNTPDNMRRWIHDPPSIDPLTPMPNLRVTDDDARD